jgi:hypothetical protein
VLRALLPNYTAAPVNRVVGVVALFAAGIPYLMSYTAVLKTASPPGNRTTSARLGFGTSRDARLR